MNKYKYFMYIFLVKIQFLKIILYVNELLLIEIKEGHSCM